MKAVIAIDSFKGSLSSAEAGDAATRAIRSVFTEADIVQFPLADGGEGSRGSARGSGPPTCTWETSVPSRFPIRSDLP